MRLALGPGPGPRLLAPGVPDWLGADGTRVGWVLRDRLFLRDESGVSVVELPDHAEDVSAGPHRWTVGLSNGFVQVDPVNTRIEALLVDDDAEPVATRPGESVGLFIEVPEHRLLRLSDGLALPLPDGALRARWIRPWATGLGACWVDMEALFRLGARVSALGRAPGPDGLACGPLGGALVALKADTVVAAPRGLAMRVGRVVDAESARFAPDGESVLAACDDGVVWIGLADGAVRRTWTGSLQPVGFAPGPVLWDRARGVLVREDGAVLLDGFAGALPGVAGRVLAGPGGAVWDLDTGLRGRTDVGGGVCVTDGERVVHVDDVEVHIAGGATFPHGLCAEDDVVDAARLDGDAIVVATLDGEVGSFALADGAVRARTTERAPWKAGPRACPVGVSLPAADDESWLKIGEIRWPIPADGAAIVGDTVWAWTTEGALVAVPLWSTEAS